MSKSAKGHRKGKQNQGKESKSTGSTVTVAASPSTERRMVAAYWSEVMTTQHIDVPASATVQDVIRVASNRLLDRVYEGKHPGPDVRFDLNYHPDVDSGTQLSAIPKRDSIQETVSVVVSATGQQPLHQQMAVLKTEQKELRDKYNARNDLAAAVDSGPAGSYFARFEKLVLDLNTRHEAALKQHEVSRAQAEKQRKADLAEADERRKADLSQAEKKRKADLAEAEKKRKADLAEAEKRRKADLAEAEEKRKADLAEAERRRKADLAEAEKRRQADLAEAEKRRKADVAQSEKHIEKLMKEMNDSREEWEKEKSKLLAEIVSLKEKLDQLGDAMEETRRLTALVAPLHLRCLLDMSRYRVIDITNMNSWETLRSQYTLQDLKGHVSKECSLSKEASNFLCEFNNIRKQGNRAAHVAEKSDVRAAIEQQNPTGECREFLEELFRFVFEEEL